MGLSFRSSATRSRRVEPLVVYTFLTGCHCVRLVRDRVRHGRWDSGEMHWYSRLGRVSEVVKGRDELARGSFEAWASRLNGNDAEFCMASYQLRGFRVRYRQSKIV